MKKIETYTKAIKGSKRIEEIERKEGFNEGVKREQDYQEYLKNLIEKQKQKNKSK